MQRITEDPVPYYKKKGFIGPVLPDYMDYMEKQPMSTIPVNRKPISLSTSLMPNRAPVVDKVGMVAGKRKSQAFQNALATAKEGGEAILPFATNIINAFRKPPRVPMPHLDSPITLQKVNMDNDRYEVEKGARGANLNAMRTLDENTAAAVGSYTLAQKYNQLSAVNQSERNQNKEISNREVLTNAGISGTNNAKMDQMDTDNVERKIAMQRENSQNLSNAVDKKIMINNEKSKANLDIKRFGILMRAYNRDGVAGREFDSLAEMNADPIGAEYGRNNAGKSEAEMVRKAKAEYKKLNDARRKRQKEDTNDFLITKKKYGGSMKYSTGGMIKLFNTTRTN